MPADDELMYQVLNNPVASAIKSGVGAPPPRIESNGLQLADEGRVLVGDNGKGIVPRFRTKVLGLFRRPGYGNSKAGPGLAIVNKTAPVHGGRVWAESCPGEEATSWPAFPAQGGLRTEARAATEVMR